ncbi:3'-5' exonuclease [Pelagimonas varians]|uniref:DNA-directed DNA polymerase n=1 Tax=Pelagimonas varians TaxID=696760 RepID=A0A238L249_9RHOB|nr:3'-5' exonuclease [Pelagimonas varians]PYG26664.1 DNA polymerase-3 subunit epsilon [Pelagimonas varians]SMX49028.1 DNA polymerase III PolC-type [Pelagimonas varians]
MFTKLSLRLRIFLFFCLIALGGTTLVLIALWLGHGRATSTTVTDGFVFAGVIAVLGTVGLTAGIWLLFDENVAKPIEKLAAEMRTRAHAGVGSHVDTDAARYLGDLAPAASAVTTALSDTALLTAQKVASETERLANEKARLTALLTEIPVAMILVNPRDQIVLYDGQAAEVLSQLGTPRLNASMSDYFDNNSIGVARAKLNKTGKEVSFCAQGRHHDQSFDARMKPMQGGGYMLMIDAEHVNISPEASRPLVYDFDLMEGQDLGTGADTPLRHLTYAVFDTETTGLLPHKDDIVQIGAVRVLNCRIVAGERINQLVNPGRPIPPASTKVHHVTDAMVADAPDIGTAGAMFHRFASGSVIVAHNAPFDMAFLHRDKDRMGVDWDHPILDTVLLSAVLFGASQTHTLDALCERLDVTIPPELRHTALGDAQATAEVLVRMLPMLEARGLVTFGDVLEETKRHGRLLEDLN